MTSRTPQLSGSTNRGSKLEMVSPLNMHTDCHLPPAGTDIDSSAFKKFAARGFRRKRVHRSGNWEEQDRLASYLSLCVGTAAMMRCVIGIAVLLGRGFLDSWGDLVQHSVRLWTPWLAPSRSGQKCPATFVLGLVLAASWIRGASHGQWLCFLLK